MAGLFLAVLQVGQQSLFGVVGVLLKSAQQARAGFRWCVYVADDITDDFQDLPTQY